MYTLHIWCRINSNYCTDTNSVIITLEEIVIVNLLHIGTSSSPVATMTMPTSPSVRSEDSSTSLVIGVVVSFVFVSTVMLTIIIIVVAFVMKRYKSTALVEQPFYDYVAPPQLPARPQRIEMEGNEAYGLAQTGTPGPQLPARPQRIEMEGNEAYGLAQTGTPGPQLPARPQRIEMKGNEAYGLAQTGTPGPQLPARPQKIEMEGNEAYGLAQTGTPGPQLPAQPERIEMEGNEAYGLAETGSPEPLKNEASVTAPQVQPNVAYGVISAP